MGMIFYVSPQKNSAKRWSGKSSVTNIPGLETWDLLLQLQIFQLWIHISTAPNTSFL